MARNLTPTEQRIVEAGTEIADWPDVERPAFAHSLLCSVGLPRKSVSGPTYERQSGKALLRITAEAPPLGSGRIPFGVRPRLTLVHLVTEAVRTGNREIEVGGSIRDFLLTLGMDTSGKGYAGFKSQAVALFSCHMVLGWIDGGHVEATHTNVASRYSAWLSGDGKQLALWPGSVTLTQEFFDSATGHAVPLDPRALQALKQSSLGLDVYQFLAQRLHRIHPRKPLRLTWNNLADQFGVTEKTARSEMASTLRKVLTVYPSANVEGVEGGLMLKHSKPPVQTIQTTVNAGKLSTGK